VQCSFNNRFENASSLVEGGSKSPEGKEKIRRGRNEKKVGGGVGDVAGSDFCGGHGKGCRTPGSRGGERGGERRKSVEGPGLRKA